MDRGKRFSHGFNVGASFAWSKQLGNANNPGTSQGNDAGTHSNYYNRRADYGRNWKDPPVRGLLTARAVDPEAAFLSSYN